MEASTLAPRQHSRVSNPWVLHTHGVAVDLWIEAGAIHECVLGVCEGLFANDIEAMLELRLRLRFEEAPTSRSRIRTGPS